MRSLTRSLICSTGIVVLAALLAGCNCFTAHGIVVRTATAGRSSGNQAGNS